MLSQGNSQWYFPAGRLWNAVALLINTLFCAAPIGRWIYPRAGLDRGQTWSLSMCPCVLPASWPLSSPSFPALPPHPASWCCQILSSLAESNYDIRLGFWDLEGFCSLFKSHFWPESLSLPIVKHATFISSKQWRTEELDSSQPSLWPFDSLLFSVPF